MTKLILNDVGSLIDAVTAANTINSNSARIETAFDNTLSRDGSSPNTMQSTFDMNSHQIVNLPTPITANSPLRLQDLSDFTGGGIVTNIPAGGTTGQILSKTSNVDFQVGWENSVTSVGLSLPADFTVTGSPVTTTGTLTATLANTPTGTGGFVRQTSPTLITPALGTPASGVATNLTGTAAGLTAGNVTTNANLTGDVTSVGNATTLTNAPVIAKVLTGYVSGAGTVSATDSILSAIQKLNGNNATNANLTGPITSVGNATAVASQTGTGSTFVMNTSPTLVTPILGTPTSGVATNLTGTASGLTAGNVTTNANLTGDVTSVGNATTLTNAPVIAKVLTGYTSGAGTVSATDSILAAIQKLNGNDATNANLTGVVTSVGNATSLGSFSSANLSAALTDETGSGVAVFGTSPTIATPVINGLPTGTGVATANTVSTLVARDGSGNFSAGAVTATSVISASYLGGSAAGSTALVNGTSNGSPSSAFLNLQSNGQFIGIGNTAPKTYLDLNENLTSSPALAVSTSLMRIQAPDAAAAGGMEWVTYGNSTPQNILSGVVSGGTSASKLATPNSCNMFNLRGYGYNGTSFQNGGLITIHTSGLTWSGTNQGTLIDFYTTPDNSTTIALAVRMNGSGGLGVGTATDPGTGGIAATSLALTGSLTAPAGNISGAALISSSDVYSGSATFLHRSTATLTNGAAASVGTLSNAPAAGNPTKWISIDDNGTTRKIPAW